MCSVHYLKDIALIFYKDFRLSFHIYYGLGQFNDIHVGYNDVGL